jgi:hypothetical protein
MPLLMDLSWRESLYTVKTISMNKEQGDGRPILFRPSAELHGFYSVLGSKLDNIYDLFEIVNSLEVMHES